MKDILLICVMTAVFIFGFFMMKRLDRFFEEYRKEQETDKQETADIDTPVRQKM